MAFRERLNSLNPGPEWGRQNASSERERVVAIKDLRSFQFR